jgi:gamma-tubulin complex component 3
MLFNALWRGKRMEYMLSCMWTKGTTLHKMARTLTEMSNVLQRAHLLSSEMVHFVHQLAYYTTFEVMECSWDLLEKQLGQSSTLDEVIEAHNEFIETLVKHALLDERSRDLLTQLRAIYDRIVEFQNIQNKLYLEAVSEIEARRSHDDEINSRTKRGQYGLTQNEEKREMRRRQEFAKTILPDIEAKLKIVSQSYQDMVKTFLLQLSCSQDQALQFLSVRLDFNEHYKRKDSRLGAPLTFQHKRLSTID